MSLRWKALAVITATFIVASGAVIAVSQFTFMKGFRNVEKENSEQMAQRAAKSLADQIGNLNILNHDWANWDDTYYYVSDPVKNELYVEINPTDTTFINAGLNFIFIVNNSGDAVFGEAFDTGNNSKTQIPESVKQLIASGTLTNPVSLKDVKSGLVLLPEGPLMVSSQPILTSQAEGPIAGTIIMARYVDKAVMAQLSSTLQLPVTMAAANDSNLPTDFQSARSILKTDGSSTAIPLNSASIAAYMLVDGIDGNPVLILKTVMPRNIYAQSVEILRYFLISLLGLAVIFIGIFNLMLDNVVIKKLSRISKYTYEVQTSGDLSIRLNPSGKDELGILKRGINAMVQTLQESQTALQKQEQSEEKLRVTIESVAEGIATTDLNGIITQANDSKISLHGFSSKEELIGKPAEDLIAPEERERAREAMSQVLNTERSGSSEYTLVRKDGSRFFGERSTALLRDYDGNPTGFVTSTRDITGRKHVEKLLKQSEEKYRLITQNMDDMVILRAMDGEIKFVSPSFERIRGFNLDEINHLLPEKNMKPRSWELFQKALDTHCTPESLSDTTCFITFTLELELYRKDGSTFWVEDTNTLIRNEDGTSDALLIISRDISERKRSEIELQKYELIASDSRDIILFLDQDGNVLQANEAAAKAYGYSREKMLAMNVRDLRNSDILATLPDQLETADSEGILFETTHKRRDGSVFPVEVSSRGASIGEGRTIVSIIRDISERKEVEKQKQELRKMLELQVSRMPLALIMFDADYRIKSWNPAAERTFGFPASEVLDKNPNEMIVPDNIKSDIDGVWQRLTEGDETAHSINQNVTKDGRVITCEWFNTPIRDYDGKFIGVLSMVEDMTQEKINQEKLARSSREWRTTFDSIKEMVSITDNNTNILRVNKAFADAVHANPKALIGKKYDEVILRLGSHLPRASAVRTVSSGESCILEFDDAQNNIHLEESSSPVVDENGNVTALVRVARDITERKKMEDRLVVADRLASIGELVAGVAHELNNPLTTVIGFSDLLARETDMDVIKEDLGIINREARRTSIIVKNLLTFARKHAPVKQISSINKAMEEVLQLRAYEQKVNNIEVVNRVAADLSEAMVDYFQIQQVFLNLVVNAEQAMIEANGRGKLTITTENMDQAIKVTISDDGPGIAPENLPKIFNPFFTTKDVGKGTGLGLSICHGIITSHGGKIEVKTKLGCGTDFVIELPLTQKGEFSLSPQSIPELREGKVNAAA